jgi:hypothetical protein
MLSPNARNLVRDRRTGGRLTVTVNEHDAVAACASVAVHCTEVDPTGKPDPEVLEQLICTGGTPPVTVGAENGTTTGLPLSEVAVRFAGHAIESAGVAGVEGGGVVTGGCVTGGWVTGEGALGEEHPAAAMTPAHSAATSHSAHRPVMDRRLVRIDNPKSYNHPSKSPNHQIVQSPNRPITQCNHPITQSPNHSMNS